MQNGDLSSTLSYIKELPNKETLKIFYLSTIGKCVLLDFLILIYSSYLNFTQSLSIQNPTSTSCRYKSTSPISMQRLRHSKSGRAKDDS